MAEPRKNNNWKWFFAALVVLGLGSAVGMIWYNQSQQLKPEQLEAARKLWDEQGPASYTLIYTQTFSSQADSRVLSNHYVVKVRDRRVVEMIVNGIPETERIEYHDMNGLFNEIEGFQEKDEKENRRVYRVAEFDKNTGAIGSFVRRVMGTSERQKITVETLEAK